MCVYLYPMQDYMYIDPHVRSVCIEVGCYVYVDPHVISCCGSM